MASFFAWIYLVCVLLRPQEYVPALLDKPIMPVALLSGFAFWIFSQKSFKAPTFLLLIAFVLTAMLSRAAIGWFGGAVDWLAEFAPTCMAFFIVSGCAQQPGRLRWFLATIAICASIMAIHGIQQATTGIGWTGMPISRAGRIVYLGIFNDPNDLGLLFLVALPITVYFLKRSVIGKPLWLACLGCLLYGIYLTDSRGAMLGTLALMGLAVWRSRGMFAAMALATPALLVLTLIPSRASEISVGESSAFGRVESWYEGLQMFQGRPLTGVGIDNFLDYHELTAHNSFVLVLAETGILGYASWLAFVGYTMFMLFRVQGGTLRVRPVKAVEGEDVRAAQADRDLAVVLLNCLIGFFCAAFFLSRSYIVFLYILCGLATGHYIAARARRPQIPEVTLSGTWFTGGSLILLSVVFFFVLVRALLIIA